MTSLLDFVANIIGDELLLNFGAKFQRTYKFDMTFVSITQLAIRRATCHAPHIVFIVRAELFKAGLR